MMQENRSIDVFDLALIDISAIYDISITFFANLSFSQCIFKIFSKDNEYSFK
jgi:hypothetical protein